LENSISFADDAKFGVDDGAVERMRNCTNKSGGCARRKLRIRVERDNVTHGAQRIEIADLDGEGIEAALQIFVQVEELAALALPSHPNPLARVEDAMAMKKKKGAVLRIMVASIELSNEAARQINERVRIIFMRPCNRVRQIRKQCEVEIAVGIREESNLKIFDKFTNLLLVHEQSGYSNKTGK